MVRWRGGRPHGNARARLHQRREAAASRQRPSGAGTRGDRRPWRQRAGGDDAQGWRGARRRLGLAFVGLRGLLVGLLVGFSSFAKNLPEDIYDFLPLYVQKRKTKPGSISY
jgi:hypothetical protein